MPLESDNYIHWCQYHPGSLHWSPIKKLSSIFNLMILWEGDSTDSVCSFSLSVHIVHSSQSQQAFPDGSNGDVTLEVDLRSSQTQDVSTDTHTCRHTGSCTHACTHTPTLYLLYLNPSIKLYMHNPLKHTRRESVVERTLNGTRFTLT